MVRDDRSGDSDDDAPRRARDERTLGPAGDDDDTFDGLSVDSEPGVEPPPESEAPTGEIEPEDRERATVDGGVAGTIVERAHGSDDRDDDRDTLDATLRTEVPTADVDLRTIAEDARSAAARAVAAREDATETETVVEGSRPADSNVARSTRADAVAGTQRPGASATRPQQGGRTGTARDPAAAGYTERGEGLVPTGGLMRLEEGENLAGRYTLVRRLGKGGMGEVWRARHNLLQGDRAIKVIKASISRDRQFRERFLKEGQTMMRVKHPGVVEVTDLDETRVNRELFMVMEYLEGRTLYEAIRDRERPLSADVRDAVRILREFALGMQRIHVEQIVHKDIKADNALLVRGDDGLEHPKVIDFGLAKRLDDEDRDVEEGAKGVDGGYDPDLRTTLSGTLAYMAPEQFRGERSSFQSDIYAFGVMAYELFTNGEYPLPRGGLAHYVQIHAEGAVPTRLAEKLPQFDRELAALFDRCMAPRRADRPESFQEVADALQWWLDAPERRRRRNRTLALCGAAVLLIGIAVTGFLVNKTTASVGAIAVRSGGRELALVGGRTAYVNARTLAGLEFSAELKGDAEGPQLLVDGEVVPVTPEVVGGATLVAKADLIALADGDHVVELRASPGAQPTKLQLVVDRKAPQFRTLAVVGGDTGFVRDPSAVVRVEFDEPTIESVVARLRNGDQIRGQLADERNPDGAWVVFGTAKFPDENKLDVEVKDLAGNVANRDLVFVLDTVPPQAQVADLRDDTDRPLLNVRAGLGAKLRAHVSEPVTVALTAGSGAPATREVAAPGDVTFDLPPVGADGYAAKLKLTDRAGNAWERSFDVRVAEDVVALRALDGSASVAASGSGALRLKLQRTYSLAGVPEVAAVRVRDASGADVRDVPVALATTVAAADAFGGEVSISLGTLAEGTWLLSATGQAGARTEPLTLVVDRTSPRIEGVEVRDAAGRVVAPGAWSQSRELQVSVVASDQALQSITVGSFTPDAAPQPGRGTYRFRVTCDADGASSFSVRLVDAAGNEAAQQLDVLADATDPVLTLSSPVSGSEFNDKEPAYFRGTCSEKTYRLHVESAEGVTGGASVTDFTKTAFDAPVILRVGEHALTVFAQDPSGRRSPAITVAVVVRRLETVLPAEHAWHHGAISAVMRQVEPGELVIGLRTFTVPRVFVDRAEVTNAQYRTFLAAGSRGHGTWCHPDEPKGWEHTPPAATWGDAKWNGDDLPVVNVAWWDAYAFAAWSGRRLPTEAEWVKAAAKSPSEPDLLRWPTGNEWHDGLLVTAEAIASDAFHGPRAADAGADVSPVGCRNMGGNVSEWVVLERVPQGDATTAVRGGNWCFGAIAANVRDVPAKRYERGQRAATIGFRCAVDADAVRAQLDNQAELR